MPPVPNITIRTQRFTSDGKFQLVYLSGESSGRVKLPTRHSYHWIEVETGEVFTSMYETETRASFWQEGYEFAAEVRKTEERNAKRRKNADHS